MTMDALRLEVSEREQAIGRALAVNDSIALAMHVDSPAPAAVD